MLRALALLFLVFNLSGCVIGAFVVGAAAGGAIIYDKRSVKEQLSDRKISELSEQRIDKDKELAEKSHISIATFHRVVLMVGQVQTPELKDRAYEIVSGVPGVKRIFNELVISDKINYLLRTDDHWITTKAKTQMLATSGLHSSDIKVVTEDGVVYLMGHVTHRQGDLATQVAREVPGVVKVVRGF